MKIKQYIIIVLLLSLPLTIAENIDNINEYSVLEKVRDNIKYRFTLQIEKREVLMKEISVRREEHYQFLLLKGKITQANTYKEKTAIVIKNFDNWKDNKLNKKEGSRNEKNK